MPTQTEAALFEGIVRENSDMLFTFIRASVADEQTREEVYQDTIVVAWQRLSDYNPSRPIGAWLRGIARKVALSKARERSAHVTIEGAVLLALEGRFDALHGQRGETFDDKLECLRECLETLSERDRSAIRTRYEDGLRGTPLAETIGVGVENAKKIVQRARERLLLCIRGKLALGEAS